MAPKAKLKHKALPASEQIRKIAFRKDVTIILDHEGHSQEAKIGSYFSYDTKSKELTIVVPLLVELDKPLLLEIIRKVFDEGGLIWKAEKGETLVSYKQYNSESEDKRIKEFFSEILSRDDFNALKMSLYLRDQQSKGRNIYEYKRDIRDRFGERGANIANLCSAGYFENEFMPLYNNVSKEEFNEYYEIAVGKKARALFVHGGMSIEDIEVEFDKMLEKALKYHVKDFRVHGLGKQNVQTIKQFFANKINQPGEKFIIKKGEEKSEPALVIEYVITIVGE